MYMLMVLMAMRMAEEAGSFFFLKALHRQVSELCARCDELHVEHIVGVGTRRGARLARAPPRGLLVVPRLEMPRDEPPGLLIGRPFGQARATRSD